MTVNPLSRLDQAELLHLALQAGSNGESGAAIGYLKEAVSRPDANGKAHFLLGAEYAQIRMYDNARAEMEMAVALDPALSIARFQLGLLWLTAGAADKARETLRPLEELGNDHALAHFSRGLMHLIADDLADARMSLQRGIECNTEHPVLSQDMQKIIDELDKLPPESFQPKDVAAMSEDASTRHVFLSAYAGKDNNH
ncbi:hypothetical protein [Noviherbaspirillum sp.]|uniref:hypothetical protein n=1 Tax=Noviherbaspirillum sp. TaxID=1926288 RepID=UPI002D73A595|nr:hypothetical protein [Noviherbaspirillum sp.]HZW21763.1 hypothetical protein [Noviherbaspirillum sp.]